MAFKHSHIATAALVRIPSVRLLCRVRLELAAHDTKVSTAWQGTHNIGGFNWNGKYRVMLR